MHYLRKRKEIVTENASSLHDLATHSFSEIEEFCNESNIILVLKSCLKKLKPGVEAVVRQRYHNEKSLDELTQDFGKSLSAIKMILHRAKKNLGVCLERNMPKSGKIEL